VNVKRSLSQPEGVFEYVKISSLLPHWCFEPGLNSIQLIVLPIYFVGKISKGIFIFVASISPNSKIEEQ
jgi:hypothetical protein